MKHNKVLQASWVDTPLGSMLVIADEEGLYLVDFVEKQNIEIEEIGKKMNLLIVLGKPDPAKKVEKELGEYFCGKLGKFTIPLLSLGSPFQKKVWEELRNIPWGKTRSYAEVAAAIGKPSACRAVGLANGANPFAIVVPCHRVIRGDGTLGGYAGGIKRKEWLLQHEKDLSSLMQR